LPNKTPIEWYSKKQATVETATYGSEFIAAQIRVEQIIDVHNTLRYLGVPIRDKSFMFGDNKSVAKSSIHLNDNLHKRHTVLYFRRVREAIATSILTLHFLSEVDNSAEILSKQWGIKEIMRALLFWKVDTANIQEGESTFQAKAECQDFSASSRGLPGVFPNAISTEINRTERLPVQVVTSVEHADATGGTQWCLGGVAPSDALVAWHSVVPW
jgi:hypothetical protein